MGVRFFDTDRGGDITYHGPGQLVAYPIVNLGEIRRDVGWYVRQLEEAMIRASADFGVTATRVAGMTGVWAARADAASDGAASDGAAGDDAAGRLEKIGAIGVHISRWVTSHGLAYNVATIFVISICSCRVVWRGAARRRSKSCWIAESAWRKLSRA